MDMKDPSIAASSPGSLGMGRAVRSTRSDEWDSDDDDDDHSGILEDDDDDTSEHSGSSYSDESESGGSNHADSHHGKYSENRAQSRISRRDDQSEESASQTSEDDRLEESRELKVTTSEDTGTRSLRSDDDTDTCLLSIDEHVRRRRAKLALRDYQASKGQIQIKTVESQDSGSHQSFRSDDEADTSLLSVGDHVRRRQSKWAKRRNGTETIDLTCLDSDVGTLEDTTLVEEGKDQDDDETSDGVSVEITTLDTRTFGSGTLESATLGSGTMASHSPIQERRAESKRTENWRIKNWRKESPAIKEENAKADERELRGVDYMSAFDIASTNRDISVVERGISKKAAREAFEKKQVPDEIPMMLRDDVSSIYPPARTFPIKTYPPKRQPFNGMILEDPVSLSYDEELGGVSTKSYEMSIVGSEGKKKSTSAQRSDLELVLIGVISLSLLILVILLIVILAKNS